jgi:hypothetical protein
MVAYVPLALERVCDRVLSKTDATAVEIEKPDALGIHLNLARLVWMSVNPVCIQKPRSAFL